MRATELSTAIAIGAEERTLDVCQEARCRRCALIIRLRRTVITDITRAVGKRSVEAYAESRCQRDVGIETDVQAIHIVEFQRALLSDIAHREVVAGHGVATLDIDAVVLGHGGVIDQVLPVGVLMVLVIIIVVGILIEEAECTVRGVCRLEQLRGIATILVGIHHRHELRLQRHTGRDVGRDTCGHRLAAARLYEDDAVGTLGTIEGRTVAHDGDLLDVGGVDGRQDVVIEPLMNRGAPILLLNDDAVDNHQGLGVDVQRVQALNEHDATHARRTVAGDGVHLRAKQLLHLVLDIHGVGVLEVRGRIVAANVLLTTVLARKGCRIEYDVVLGFAFLQAHTHSVKVRHGDEYRCGEDGNLQFVGTVILCQYGVAFDVVGSDNRTSDGLSRGSIEHTTTDDTCRILLLLFLDDTDGGFSLVFRIIVLRHDAYREGHQQC